jgi:hypothetical protein
MRRVLAGLLISVIAACFLGVVSAAILPWIYPPAEPLPAPTDVLTESDSDGPVGPPLAGPQDDEPIK